MRSSVIRSIALFSRVNLVAFPRMPLHKYAPRLWETLKLKKGIYARLPEHYLRSLQETRPPTPVHWKPLGVKYRLNPKTGLRERVQDVPIEVYYPPESQNGLWGGEGWVSGYKYANNDKVGLLNLAICPPHIDHMSRVVLFKSGICLSDGILCFFDSSPLD